MLTFKSRVARQCHHVGGAEMAPFSDCRGEVEAVLGVELGLLGAGHGTLNFAKWERVPASDDDLEADILMTVLQVAVVRGQAATGNLSQSGRRELKAWVTRRQPHQDKRNPTPRCRCPGNTSTLHMNRWE